MVSGRASHLALYTAAQFVAMHIIASVFYSAVYTLIPSRFYIVERSPIMMAVDVQLMAFSDDVHDVVRPYMTSQRMLSYIGTFCYVLFAIVTSGAM